jgi:arylsulfatase A-like enzyme
MRGRRAAWLIGAIAALAAACSPAAPKRNVLIVVLDTFRADRLAAYGGRRGLTPFLDELATRGAVFERAYAASSWTSPSVASLLTSRQPLQHAIRGFDSVLGDAEVTLAETLRPLGYGTAGFSANLRLTAALGYGQGFDTWHAYLAGAKGQLKVRGAHLRREALAWLDARAEQKDGRPVLLYLQFMDTHSPYDPPQRLRSHFAPGLGPEEIVALNARLHDLHATDRFSAFTEEEVARLRALYDAESVALDTELRLLFADLETRRFLDGAFVGLTADHGEEFREHGLMMHGNSLFEAAVRVPLLLIGPGIEPGRRVAEPVSLVDVAPTLLALLGVPAPPSFEGRSLLPRLVRSQQPEGAREPSDVLLELASQETPIEQQPHVLGLLHGSRKLLVNAAGRPVVYDLARDPEERAADTTSEGNLDLVARLLAEHERLAARAAAGISGTVDEQTKKQLRALGYAVDPPIAGDAQPEWGGTDASGPSARSARRRRNTSRSMTAPHTSITPTATRGAGA